MLRIKNILWNLFVVILSSSFLYGYGEKNGHQKANTYLNKKVKITSEGSSNEYSKRVHPTKPLHNVNKSGIVKVPIMVHDKQKNTVKVSSEYGLSKIPHNLKNVTQDNLQSSQRIPQIAKKTGVPLYHMETISNFTFKNNVLLGIRPVEPLTQTLIEEGYPTKNFHIKGKSSNWGPHHGFISLNQGFSKLENQGEKIPEFNQAVNNVLDKGEHAVASVLKLSANRISELSEVGQIQTQVNSDQSITMISKAPSGKTYTFKATPNPDGLYEISQGGKQFMVLSSPETKMPITADYDLAFVTPEVSNIDASDISLLPEVDFETYSKRHQKLVKDAKYRESAEKNRQLAQNKNNYLALEDPNLGNISPRVKKTIKELNQELGREDNPVFHHGADITNPFSEEKDNYPLLIFLPKKIGEFGTDLEGNNGKVTMIHNTEEMAKFIQTAKDSGYHFNVNPKWGDQLKSIKRTKFNEAKKLFDN